MTDLTIFYDAECPLCSLEMRHLKAADRQQRIALENLRAADFSARFPEIDRERALKTLHARTGEGTLLTGLAVTERAWRLVGFGPLVAPLRCPLTRPLFDRAYDQFARRRHRISRMLMALARCTEGSVLAGLLPDEFRPKGPPQVQAGVRADDDCGCGQP